MDSILKDLSLKELKEFRTEIDKLIFLKKPENKNETIFYEILRNKLKTKLNMNTPPYSTIKKTEVKLKEKVSELDIFLEDNYKGNLTKDKRTELYDLCLDVLIDYMINETEMLISLTSIINMSKLIPNLIDKSFPFYLENGLLSYIIK